MKIWSYNIWDGDQGIIFAETEEEAIAVYESNYDESIADGECLITYVCDVPDRPKIMCMNNDERNEE